jgi:hydroxyacylglutathione hydrolase
MDVFPIPAFKDNYIWAWINPLTGNAWVVDPGDAQPVEAKLKQLNATLEGILLTHHHHDHSGGIEELVHANPKVNVYGAKNSSIHAITHHLGEGDHISSGKVTLQVLAIPGHTLDHIAFINQSVLFCGDTLFSAGCGRVFEGTMLQMYHALLKLKGLPGYVEVYCGHEYTEANLHFALAVEPANPITQEKLKVIEVARREGRVTLPSTIDIERKINPFLRCNEPSVRKAAEAYAACSLKTEEEVFSALRDWKNHFTT